ncbi:DUF3800 domain-containing protein [Nocardioides sp. Leaf285]|uniref:DUF3800 domain-containing protein n=1 Tax=Nocardioides sp. Leaf285 TaxID=1736322 RepID=UPI000702BBDD|nr:DUF3800 domain-containing protein [Nocardioides sp. Leaf285]KQP63738.1 hypothetical protein ASF47_17265 [Nocardioides sp. Leaf285]
MSERRGLHGTSHAAHFDDATRDAPDTRWVATDESGWDGEQLIGRYDRFMTIGSVACDDINAEAVLDHLRRTGGITATGELKFKHVARSQRRLEALGEVVVSKDLLGGRCSIYVVDKHYMAAAKLVDLLIEEYAHERRINLYADAMNVVMSRALATEAAAQIGDELHLQLLQTVVDFASMPNADGEVVAVTALMDCIARAHEATTGGLPRRVLELATRCEKQAHEHLHHLRRLSRDDDPGVAPLEPLVPAIAALVGNWVQRLGPVSVLADEQLTLTDEVLDTVSRISPMTLNEHRTGWQRRGPRATVHRGRSVDHPSIQVADLIAGAGLAVARSELDDTRRVPGVLRRAVLSSVDVNSLLPHDERDRIAHPPIET